MQNLSSENEFGRHENEPVGEHNREFKKTTTATATVTSLNKRVNDIYARAL